MSNAADTARAAAEAAGLGDADLDHLEAFCEFVDDNGREPSIRELAWYNDRHPSTVGAAVARLRDAGALVQDRAGMYKLPRKRPRRK